MRKKFVKWGVALAALTLMTAPAVSVAETELEISGVGALRYVNHLDTTITGTAPMPVGLFTYPVPGYSYDAGANDRFMLNQLRFTAVATSGDTSTHATVVLGEDASGNQNLTGLGAGTVDLEEMYVEQKLQEGLTIIGGKFATWGEKQKDR